MATAKGTESHKISSELLNKVREVAAREDRSVRKQLERFVHAGMRALPDG